MYLTQMWAYIYPEIVKAIQTEPEVDILQQHMESFGKVRQEKSDKQVIVVITQLFML